MTAHAGAEVRETSTELASGAASAVRSTDYEIVISGRTPARGVRSRLAAILLRMLHTPVAPDEAANDDGRA